MISQYNYSVNVLGQRSAVSQTGTAFSSARSIAWGYDPLGQVIAADSSINTADRAYQYDPFGNTVVNTDTGNLFNYKFSTKPQDPETSLYYYGYRYYDPMTGRWPSRDPIGVRGGWILYGYVRNNSISRVDFLGRDEVNLSEGAGAFFNALGVLGGVVVDAFVDEHEENEAANDQFDEVLSDYFTPGGSRSYSFDQSSPWTQAIMKKPVYDRMRAFLKKMARESCEDGTMIMGHSGKWDDSADNAPLLQPLWDLINYGIEVDVQSLGSNDGTFTITGVDCSKCTMTYEMLVEDAFRFGSNFRIPQSSVGPPDNPLGAGGAFGTVEVTWSWEESLKF